MAALEAEAEALYAENQGLNKQQAALSGEVRMLGGAGVCRMGAASSGDEGRQAGAECAAGKLLSQGSKEWQHHICLPLCPRPAPLCRCAS